jgi:hypothetical protein
MPSIDRAGAAKEQQPCHYIKYVWHAERDDRAEKRKATARRIGPFNDQCLHGADGDADRRGAERVDERIADARQEQPLGEQPAVKAQRERAE